MKIRNDSSNAASRLGNAVANRTLILAIIIVALTGAVLPSITGYGTLLFELIVFSAWDVLALVSSHDFVREHKVIFWLVAAFVNVFAFLMVALPLYVGTRNRLYWISPAAIVTWTALYIAALFWLVPVTH